MTTFVYPQKKLQELEAAANQIMKEEMQLNCRGLLLNWNHYVYRIRILLFEDEKRLGYFDPEHFEIGIHKAIKNYRDVLRHELAHMVAFLRFGHLGHGKIFQTICQEYGFPPEIEKTTAPLVEETHELRIVSKIKKLLALSESSNSHEAESATLKAQELLLKHNIDHIEEESNLVMRRIFSFKRAGTKQKAIAHILRTFGVQPVFCSKTLEIFGQRVHVEIAEYVAHFLSNEFDRLYSQQPHLRGLAAKNSFFRGIASGFVEKIKKQQAKHERALYQIDYTLQKAIPFAYPNLRTTRTRVVDHKEGTRAGKKTGQNLKIRQGVTANSPSQRSITH